MISQLEGKLSERYHEYKKNVYATGVHLYVYYRFIFDANIDRRLQ